MDKIAEFVTLPDFAEWTSILLSNTHPAPEIQEALKEAFKQGYHLGLNKGWQVEQDEEHQNDRAIGA